MIKIVFYQVILSFINIRHILAVTNTLDTDLDVHKNIPQLMKSIPRKHYVRMMHTILMIRQVHVLDRCNAQAQSVEN